MKKIIILFAIFTAVACHAADADTVVYHKPIVKAVIDTQLNSKGKEVKKYYFITDGTLITTNKASYEKYNLTKKYGLAVKVYAVRQKGLIKRLLVL